MREKTSRFEGFQCSHKQHINKHTPHHEKRTAIECTQMHTYFCMYFSKERVNARCSGETHTRVCVHLYTLKCRAFFVVLLRNSTQCTMLRAPYTQYLKWLPDSDKLWVKECVVTVRSRNNIHIFYFRLLSLSSLLIPFVVAGVSSIYGIHALRLLLFPIIFSSPSLPHMDSLSHFNIAPFLIAFTIRLTWSLSLSFTHLPFYTSCVHECLNLQCVFFCFDLHFCAQNILRVFENVSEKTAKQQHQRHANMDNKEINDRYTDTRSIKCSDICDRIH